MSRFVLPVLLFLGGSAIAQTFSVPAEFVEWPAIPPEDRATNAPSVEKDSGAEILIWRARVSDNRAGQDLQRVTYNYIRLKIFDQKGVKSASTIDLTYREPGAILNVAGRTTRADGTVVELDRTTVFKRDVLRAGGLKEKSVSFAMPAVEPGAIVEYRWEQTEDDNRFRYLALHFQRDLPVRRVTFFVKPLDRKYLINGDQLYLLPLNCKPTPIKSEPDDWVSTSLENIPAARHEVMAPSDLNIEPWALLYYRASGQTDANKFWAAEGRDLYKAVKESAKTNGDIKAAAAAATRGAGTADEKITALSSWVHQNVRNVYDGEVTTAERAAFFQKQPKERERTSVEILKTGLGTSRELHVLFIALATEAGLDAHPALVSSRLETAFDPSLTPDPYFLDNFAAAVKVADTGKPEDKWRVVDLNHKFIAAGRLPWYEEGVTALVGDSKTPEFIPTAVTPPEATEEQRTAFMRLYPDGSLEGNVEETIGGHRAEERRQAAGQRSNAQWQEDVLKRVQQLFPQSDVTKIVVEDVDDVSKPIHIRYHVKAPLYAQVTGKRILFQPMPFQRAQGTLFTAAERRFPIEFPYAWKEVDEIHIAFPPGYSMDNASAPQGLTFGDLGAYTVKIGYTKGEQSEVITKREFTFGGGGHLKFAPDRYSVIKRIFDEVHAKDGHTLSLISQ